MPIGYFSTLQAINHWLVEPLEVQGHDLPERCVPDTSVDQSFCRWFLEVIGMAPNDFGTYWNAYEDG